MAPRHIEPWSGGYPQTLRNWNGVFPHGRWPETPVQCCRYGGFAANAVPLTVRREVASSLAEALDSSHSRIRLVVTDLDGTLLRSDGQISDTTRNVLLELHERAVPVLVATARPRAWIMHLLDHMPYLSGAICSNGALVIDAKSRRVVHQAVLGPKLLRSVVASVRDRFGPVPIAVDYIAAAKLARPLRQSWMLCVRGAPAGASTCRRLLPLVICQMTWVFSRKSAEGSLSRMPIRRLSVLPTQSPKVTIAMVSLPTWRGRSYADRPRNRAPAHQRAVLPANRRYVARSPSLNCRAVDHPNALAK